MNTLIACCEGNKSDLIWVVANQDANTFLVTFVGVAVGDVINIYLNGDGPTEYIVTQDMIDNGITIAGQDGDTILAQTSLGNTAEDTLDGDVVVVPNNTPIADAGADQDDIGGGVTLDGSGSVDQDGQIVSWVWTDEDGNVVGTGETIDVSPTVDTIYTLTVTDNNGATDTDTVLVTVTNPDECEGVGSAIFGNLTVEDDYVTYTIDFSNVDEWQTVYLYKNGVLMENHVVTAAEANGELYNGGYHDDGVTTLTWTATTENCENTTTSLTYTPEQQNNAPTADAGNDIGLESGVPATLDGSGSTDSDGDIVSWVWTDEDGNVVGTGETITVTPDTTTTYTLTVTDDDGATSTDTVTVSVPNSQPTADAGDDLTNGGDGVTLDGSGSTDPDGQIVSYEWTDEDGNVVGTGETIDVDPDTTTTYTLTVTDNDGATSTDTVTVSVPPQPLTADAGPDQYNPEGYEIILDGSGSFDGDGEIVSYVWTDEDGNVIGTGEVIIAYPIETTTYTLTVTDNDGNTDTDTVTIIFEQYVDPCENMQMVTIDDGVGDGDSVSWDVHFDDLQAGQTVKFSFANPITQVVLEEHIVTAEEAAGAVYTITQQHNDKEATLLAVTEDCKNTNVHSTYTPQVDSDTISISDGECDGNGNVVFVIDCSDLEVGDVITYGID